MSRSRRNAAFFTASGQPTIEADLRLFSEAVIESILPDTPVLLIGIGSDLAMMEALNECGRPFHQRATALVIPPLSPADAAEMLAWPAAEAFDAYLVLGGLPLVLDEWPSGLTALAYVAQVVADPLSALLVSGNGP
jgi:hypothetical protein